MTFDPYWAQAFDQTVKAMMRAIRDEFPDGKVEEFWLNENTGGSVNGRKALGHILREAVKRGVVTVDPHQADRLAHHGSAGHDDTAAQLLAAESAKRPGSTSQVGEGRRWSFVVHEDGRYVSINDGRSGDTLLKITDHPEEAYGDVAKVRAFAADFATPEPQEGEGGDG